MGGTPGVQDASWVSLWATCLPSLLGDLVPSCRPWLIPACDVTSPFPSTTVLLQILFFFVCPDTSCHLCNIGSDLPLLQWLKLNKAAEKPLQELLRTAPAMTSAWVNGQSPTSHLGFSTTSSKGDERGFSDIIDLHYSFHFQLNKHDCKCRLPRLFWPKNKEQLHSLPTPLLSQQAPWSPSAALGSCSGFIDKWLI